MSYELSMSPEFWFEEGEPYDRSDLAVNSKGQPVSVYSAISLACERESFRNNAHETLQLNCSPDILKHVIVDALMHIASETNTSSNLDSPVEVWIDKEGELRVFVYEADR